MNATLDKDEYKDLAPEVAEALRAMGGGEVLTRERHPIVEVIPENQKPGRFLQGVFLGSNEWTDDNGQLRKVHNFKLIATNAPTTQWDRETRKASPVEVKAGEKVSLFGSTQIDEALAAYPKDTAVFLAYLGKMKGKKNSYHNWKIVRPNSSK